MFLELSLVQSELKILLNLKLNVVHFNKETGLNEIVILIFDFLSTIQICLLGLNEVKINCTYLLEQNSEIFAPQDILLGLLLESI